MIKLEDINVSQGKFHLKELNLEIPKGTYAAMMGRSGCGKTTVMEIICGLRRIVSGRIFLGDREVTHMKPAERGVGYVPQDRALFTTMKVRFQLAFSLLLRHQPAGVIAQRVDELANWLEIEHLLDRMPEGLSGGEAQRVALGRALASRPHVLCLDEPLSALDEALHEEMCSLLKQIHQQTKITILHVTHSKSEAKKLANQFWHFETGRIRKAE